MLGPTDLPTGEAKTARVREMFDTIAPRYDLVNRIMTLGLDQLWRRAAVRALSLPAGALVLDLACGTGDLSRLAASRGYRVFGADLSWAMLQTNHTRTAVVECDVAHLPLRDGCVDGVVCGYALRNFTDLQVALAEIARVVRAGGRIAFLEVSSPASGPLRMGHQLWFDNVVPAIGAALSDREAYGYLPRSTAYLPDEDGLRRLFVNAGFSAVGRRQLSGGLSQLLTGTRRGFPPTAITCRKETSEAPDAADWGGAE